LSEVPASAASASPAPPSGTSSPNPRREHPLITAAHALTTSQCFVKVCLPPQLFHSP
jgi:hypothetical protein